MAQVGAMTRPFCRLSLLASIAVMALAWPSSSAIAADCDRACLTTALDRYLDALLKHDPSAAPLAANAVFTENGTRLKTGEGLWKTATKIRTRREVFADVTTGQVAFWGVLEEGGSPVMLSLRLKLTGDRITESEAVVARKGSHALFVPDNFASTPPAFQDLLQPSARVPREKLVAAANGYFDGLQQHDNRLVPSATVCNRYENGQQMTNRDGVITPRACAVAVDRLTYIKGVINRRFPIVDEQRGVVYSTILFDIPADASATPPREARMLLLTEVFKIVSGEIQRIETVMHNLPYGAASGWPDR
jgi:hypothetical protein